LTASPWRDAPVDLRVEVTPPWPFRIGRGSGDGILRRRGATLMRLLHVGEEPVLVAVAQTAPQRVLFAARSACGTAAAAAIERMRFATGVDDDLRPFYERFADDPVIGVAVRSRPHIRIQRRADPWEALAWSITEQLIELQRALVIQRRLVFRLGRRCPHSGLRDMPTPAQIAALAPAELQSYDLAARRAQALRHAAREIAAGRVDLADRERAWRRLRAIPNIGPWTLEMLSLYGQGHYDRVPAGDLGYLKLVGRLTTGHPKARADEAEVRGFFERYGEWKGLAGTYLIIAAGAGLLTEPRRSPGPAPRPAGTRWSAPLPRSAAA
jgi:DNA-3-methyladenine glycosylase II